MHVKPRAGIANLFINVHSFPNKESFTISEKFAFVFEVHQGFQWGKINVFAHQIVHVHVLVRGSRKRLETAQGL